tara:strand:- start:321 stop:836 length:516 start_codon:yes stop_codon:yes gene_type:complete
MKSALEYLGKSLTNSLSYSSEVLFEVGETKSMSSFELEMTSWAMAFYVFSEIELSLPILTKDDLDEDFLLKVSEFNNEQLMEVTQSVFDTVNEEVSQGVLIPRVRGHILRTVSLLNLKLQNHLDFVEKFRASTESENSIQNYFKNESEEFKEWMIRFLEEDDQKDLMNQLD